MAAMKPRTGDGPLEVVEEGRSIIMRVPLEGGGRLVVEIAASEAVELRDALEGGIPEQITSPGLAPAPVGAGPSSSPGRSRTVPGQGLATAASTPSPLPVGT